MKVCGNPFVWFGRTFVGSILVNKGHCIIFGCLMVGLAATSLADYGGTLVSNAGFEVKNPVTVFADEWWTEPPGTATTLGLAA